MRLLPDNETTRQLATLRLRQTTRQWLRQTTRQRVNETTSGAVAGLLSCRLVVCEATAKPNASATCSLVVS